MSRSAADYLRELDQKATPGPWNTDARVPMSGETFVFRHVTSDSGHIARVFSDDVYDHDSQLIVALRTLLPALADVIEKAGTASAAWHNMESDEIECGASMAILRESLRHLVSEIEKAQK